jgi:hypothetical protein
MQMMLLRAKLPSGPRPSGAMARPAVVIVDRASLRYGL